MKYKSLVLMTILILGAGLGVAEDDEQYLHIEEALEESPLTAFVLAFNGLIILTSLYFIIKISVEVWRNHIIHG